MLHELTLQELVVNDCWNRIGVKGDGSCPELKQHVHCRNCPIYAAAGTSLFDREPPRDCVQEWTEQIAQFDQPPSGDLAALLVFRCAEEWLGLQIDCVVEVGEPRDVRCIPHRTSKLLLGLVNIRGELQLCVALRELLGIDDSIQQTDESTTEGQGGSASRSAKTRLVVAERQSQCWAFVVDEVAGVMRFPLSEVGNVPATVANSLARYSRGVLNWNGNKVGVLDDERLFSQLGRAIG